MGEKSVSKINTAFSIKIVHFNNWRKYNRTNYLFIHSFIYMSHVIVQRFEPIWVKYTLWVQKYKSSQEEGKYGNQRECQSISSVPIGQWFFSLYHTIFAIRSRRDNNFFTILMWINKHNLSLYVIKKQYNVLM